MTTFTEARADHHVARAAAALRESDKNIWKAAYHACKMWGHYQHYGVKSIADAAQKSVSQIENYAHAYDLFTELCKFGYVCEIRKLRRRVSPSHFWKMWSAKNTYGLMGWECVKYLMLSASNGWSGDRMIEELLVDLGKKRPPLKVQTVCKGIAAYAAEILARVNDFTTQQREAAQVVLNVFGDASQEAE